MISLKEITKQQKQMVFLIALIGITVILILNSIIIQPQLQRYGLLRQQVNNMKKEVALLKQNAKEIHLLRETAEEFDGAWEQYGKYLSQGADLSILLERLSSIAKTSDVTLLSINPNQGEIEPFYQGVSFDLEARGGYDDLGVFLNNLELDEFYFEVEHFVIKTNKNRYQEQLLELKIKSYVSN